MVPGSKEQAANSEETKPEAEEDHGIKSLGTGPRKPSAEGAEGQWMASGISAQNPRDTG